jgi:hypothetical protein
MARDVLAAGGPAGRGTGEVVHQYAPSFGLSLGNNYVRFGPVALSAEFSAAMAFFGSEGPAFAGGAARATGYGRRMTYSLGLGARYGR